MMIEDYIRHIQEVYGLDPDGQQPPTQDEVPYIGDC